MVWREKLKKKVCEMILRETKLQTTAAVHTVTRTKQKSPKIRIFKSENFTFLMVSYESRHFGDPKIGSKYILTCMDAAQ